MFALFSILFSIFESQDVKTNKKIQEESQMTQENLDRKKNYMSLIHNTTVRKINLSIVEEQSQESSSIVRNSSLHPLVHSNLTRIISFKEPSRENSSLVSSSLNTGRSTFDGSISQGMSSKTIPRKLTLDYTVYPKTL